MLKKDKLSVRERKFIKFLAQGYNQTEAFIKAGYSEKTARVCASKKLTKLDIRKSFVELLDEAGLTDHKLSQVMAEGVAATKVISCNVIAANGEGMKDANSMTKDFVDVPDWMARHKFCETAVKVKGHMVDKQDVKHSGAIKIEFIRSEKKA